MLAELKKILGTPSTAPKPGYDHQTMEILEAIEATDDPFFITGRAGTGKSTLLQHLRQSSKKNIIVLAPTGVAALNVHGETIHRFFHFRTDITVERVRRSRRDNQKYRNIDTLVIDEASMVRADLMDCVEKFLRINGPKPHTAWGGVQMIFVGDLAQLPPIVDTTSAHLFSGAAYKTPWFLSAHSVQTLYRRLRVVNLTKIHRQTDPEFIEILNALRSGEHTREHLDTINTRVQDTTKPILHDTDSFTVRLVATRRGADFHNQEHLRALQTPAVRFRGFVMGDFPEDRLPTPIDLVLKPGTQIMMLNNDREKRWVNGTIGVIQSIDNKDITVTSEDGRTFHVEPFTWENVQYYWNEEDERIETEVIGSFTQYPLQLAWAITIHKSQGKTFEKVFIDFERGTFAHGQAYVALSRCRSLQGITLERPLATSDIIVDPRIVRVLRQLDIVDEPQKTQEAIALLGQ